MRVPEVRRLKKEDFDSKDQDLVGKLAFPLNLFMEQTHAVLNKGVDFTNLNMQMADIEITAGASNIPALQCQFPISLNSKIAGCVCINAFNADLASPTSTVTGQPFITFTENSGLVTVNRIFGLPTGVKFKLRLLVIGS